MTKILFLYNNIIDSAILTGSSEVSGLPVGNTQHPFRTKVWRTAGSTPGTANLVIDHGVAKSIDCVALINYNWTSAPTTLDLEFSPYNIWTGAYPSATESLTWSATPTINGNKACIIKKFSSHMYRYNRLNVVDPTGDWDLGRIFLGQYFQPDENYEYKYKGNFKDPSKILQTIGGQDHVDIVEIYRTLLFSTILKSQVQWELYQKMINHVGQYKDLFIAFDHDNEPNEMTMYGKFIRIPNMTSTLRNLFDLKFSFKESR